ncbi:hypothetical protein D3C75_835370 [compost metagenome]
MTEHEESADEYASAGDYAKALKDYSEAKNAASKIKDKVHFQLLRGKQRVAQLVTDGDGYVQDGTYDMAVESYNKALEESKKYKPFKEEDIKAKIERSDAIASLSETMKEGDKLFQGQDYNGAFAIYQQAKNAAIDANYESGLKQVETKITETEDKIDKIYKETKTLKADNLEKKGDRSLAAMDYAAAIEAYTLAQEIYQEIDKLERVLAMERKITKADEKLHPITPASQGDNSNAATVNDNADMNAPASTAEDNNSGKNANSSTEAGVDKSTDTGTGTTNTAEGGTSS